MQKDNKSLTMTKGKPCRLSQVSQGTSTSLPSHSTLGISNIDFISEVHNLGFILIFPSDTMPSTLVRPHTLNTNARELRPSVNT